MRSVSAQQLLDAMSAAKLSGMYPCVDNNQVDQVRDLLDAPLHLECNRRRLRKRFAQDVSIIACRC